MSTATESAVNCVCYLTVLPACMLCKCIDDRSNISLMPGPITLCVCCYLHVLSENRAWCSLTRVVNAMMFDLLFSNISDLYVASLLIPC